MRPRRIVGCGRYTRRQVKGLGQLKDRRTCFWEIVYLCLLSHYNRPMIIVLFAIVGFLVGGLINLLADDLPQRVPPQPPRCIQCRYQYGPAGWFALGRFLFLGGKCPQCRLPTRRRGLLVEIITPLLFAALPLFLQHPADLLFGALYVAILLLVIVTDLEHRLILHAVTFPGTLFALVGSLFMTTNSIVLALLGATFGFGVFFAFYWLGRFLFGPGALGFGDVTLSTMLGAMLGFPYVVFALVIGVLLGGLVSLLLIVTRRIKMSSYTAYGPYLAAAGILVIIWGEPLLVWYLG